MAFGISYEMIITIFVVLFGILFVVLGYSPLAVPFVQLSFLLGMVVTLIGWMGKDYDQFYTGILLMIIPLVLLSVLPAVGASKAEAEGSIVSAIAPIMAGIHWLYTANPLLFVLFFVIFAYALAKK